jgi:histidinol-phosphatase
MLDLLQGSLRQRGFGDFYQHMLVAEGAGEVAIDPIMSPWDIAALLVIVEEAGGRATTLSGERTIYGRSLVSTNARLHDRALAILGGRGA